MFDNMMNFFKKFSKKEEKAIANSRDAAKERLHLVLMQDRANVSADFLELMKQEIIEVIKKYIDVDESAIDVRLTNKENEDGTNGAPALYANIPILNIKNEARKVDAKEEKGKNKDEDKKQLEKSVKKEDKKEESVKQTGKVILDNDKKDSEEKYTKNEENEKQPKKEVTKKEEKAKDTKEKNLNQKNK